MPTLRSKVYSSLRGIGLEEVLSMLNISGQELFYARGQKGGSPLADGLRRDHTGLLFEKLRLN